MEEGLESRNTESPWEAAGQDHAGLTRVPSWEDLGFLSASVFSSAKRVPLPDSPDYVSLFPKGL